MKVLEALAAARAVVGTPLGVEGIGFESGVHGLCGESPAQLADATARLLADRALCERLGGEGRRRAEGYRWVRALAPAERIYREWLA